MQAASSIWFPVRAWVLCVAVLLGIGCDDRPLASSGAPTDAGTGAQGAAPADGRCGLTPRMLVNAGTYPLPPITGTVQVGVGGIVVAGSDLYYEIWAVETGTPSEPYLSGALFRVQVMGGPPTEIASGYLFGQILLTQTDLIVARSNVYPNSDPDDVVSIPREGGPPSPLVTFTTNEAVLGGPVTDGTLVYFSTTEAVRAFPLPPTLGPVATIVDESAWGIALGGGRLVMFFSQGQVENVPVPPPANSAPNALASNAPPGPSNALPCGPDICWLSGDAIERIAPSGGPVASVVVLTGAVASPFDMVFDGDRFFVRGQSSYDSPTAIATVPAGGGPQTVLISTNGTGAFAIDDECLYWSGAQGIFSVAKTARGPFDE